MTIIFTRTKRTAASVARDLSGRGFATAELHGDLGQGAREQAMRAFRKGKVDVLVATDVAARGIDVDDVTHVINYQCPEDEDVPTPHRPYRSCRGIGTAVTFVDWDDVPRWSLISNALGLEFPTHWRPTTLPRTSTDLDIPTDVTGRLPAQSEPAPAWRPRFVDVSGKGESAVAVAVAAGTEMVVAVPVVLVVRSRGRGQGRDGESHSQGQEAPAQAYPQESQRLSSNKLGVAFEFSSSATLNIDEPLTPSKMNYLRALGSKRFQGFPGAQFLGSLPRAWCSDPASLACLYRDSRKTRSLAGHAQLRFHEEI